MITIKEDKNCSRIYLSIENFSKLTRVAVDKAFYQLGKMLKKTAKESILKKPKHGKVYFHRDKLGRRIKHVASAPGEPPANMTGNLHRNLFWEVKPKRLIFGNKADYGAYLELGTRKMKRRTYLLTAIRANRNKMTQLFDMALKKKVEGVTGENFRN